AGWLRRRSRHHTIRAVQAPPTLDSPGQGPASRASLAASGSPLFQSLAQTPVSTVTVVAIAVVGAAGPAVRWALRSVLAVLAALPLLTGIGAARHEPVGQAGAAPVQTTTTPTTAAHPRPPVVARAA